MRRALWRDTARTAGRGRTDERRMNIGIHDSEWNGFPNLALMKISAYHKKQNDHVEWFMPIQRYDMVYSSKIFTFTKECEYLPEWTIKGGTGYGIYDELPKEIDDTEPDYSIYPNCKHAVGFLTRGCIRKCEWCVVPKKEGLIRAYRDWREIKRNDSKDIVLMDNNVLASDHGIKQIENMIGHDVRIDFNQGLDARLITSDIADMLSRLHWIRFIRMSCDTDSMLDIVINRIHLLERCGVKPYRVFVYLLVQDIQSAEKRALALRDAGAEVFAQPYRDLQNNTEPTKEMRDFARWVNRKEIFKSTQCFADYKRGENNR